MIMSKRVKQIDKLINYLELYKNLDSLEICSDETFMKDLIYGVGISFSEKYEFSDGYKKFIAMLSYMYKNTCETQYCLSKTKKDSLDLIGHSHGSDDGDNTLCGVNATENPEVWYLTHNKFDGNITCPKCLKFLVKK